MNRSFFFISRLLAHSYREFELKLQKKKPPIDRDISSIKIVFVATFLITQIWQKMNIDLTHNLHLFTEASNGKYFL